jgi:uncharacterized HAD superfamily protein
VKAKKNGYGIACMVGLMELTVRSVKEMTMNKPKAIIVDIDGTVAHKTDRDIYDYEKALSDSSDAVIIEIVKALWLQNYKIIFITGRSDECIQVTREWLRLHCPPYIGLHMRQAKDFRKDAIVKKELYEQYVKDHYDVLCVFDDRNQVVDMWREIGLKCLQVQPGDF